MRKEIKRLLVLKQCSEEGRPFEELKKALERLTKQTLVEEELTSLLKSLESEGMVYLDKDGWWLTTAEGDKELNVLLKDKNLVREMLDVAGVSLSKEEFGILKLCSESEPQNLKGIIAENGLKQSKAKKALEKLSREFFVISTEEGWWLTLNGAECLNGKRKVKIN